MNVKLTKEQLNEICKENNWFDKKMKGVNELHSSLCRKLENGIGLDEIVTIVFMCSENANREEIVKQFTPFAIKEERIKLVRAMETLARAVNNESVFMNWLSMGVADGDIKQDTEDEELEFYTQDEVFSELMDTFLDLMSDAKENGGLYCDGIVNKSE